jgi:hypothetical protein
MVVIMRAAVLADMKDRDLQLQVDWAVVVTAKEVVGLNLRLLELITLAVVEVLEHQVQLAVLVLLLFDINTNRRSYVTIIRIR